MSYIFDLPVPVAQPAMSLPGFRPLQWAKEHCPSYVTNDAIQKQGTYYYRFYFGSKRDLVAFALRWA